MPYLPTPSIAFRRYELVVQMLKNMRAGVCWLGPATRYNWHLESQALALASAVGWHPEHSARHYSTHGPKHMVPLDYIGRIEHLATDFLELLDVAGHARGAPVITAEQRRALEARLLNSSASGLTAAARLLNSSASGVALNARTSRGALLEVRLRNATLDALVRQVYAQDVACGFEREREKRAT